MAKRSVRNSSVSASQRAFTYAAIVGVVLAIFAFIFISGLYFLSPEHQPDNKVNGSAFGFAVTVGGWVAGFLAVFLVLTAVVCWIHSVVSRAQAADAE